MFLLVLQVRPRCPAGEADGGESRATTLVASANSAGRAQLRARRVLQAHGWEVRSTTRIQWLSPEFVLMDAGPLAQLGADAARLGTAFQVELFRDARRDGSPVYDVPMPFLHGRTGRALSAPRPRFVASGASEPEVTQGLLDATRQTIQRSRELCSQLVEERGRAHAQLDAIWRTLGRSASPPRGARR
jgi:hypothetical protein